VAYADSEAGAQEAGLAVAKPETWGWVAEWVGEQLFGGYFGEVKTVAEFVYQLTSISDVVTLLQAVVSLAKGDTDGIDGFEVTFAAIGIGVTALTVFTGGTAAPLKAGLVAIKPVMKELFATGAKEALQTGVIVGKFLFARIKDFISNPRQAMSEAAEFGAALVDVIKGGARSVTYLFRTVRSLDDLNRWLRLRKLKGACLVAGGQEAPLRYVTIGPEGQAWFFDTVAGAVKNALLGRAAHASEACLDILGKLDEIEKLYGPAVHNAVANATDILHANNLGIWDVKSLDTLATVAAKAPAVVETFAKNAVNGFPTKKGWKLPVTGNALDIMLKDIGRVPATTPGYDGWAAKLGGDMLAIKCIAGEAQAVGKTLDRYGESTQLTKLSDRVDESFENLAGTTVAKNQQGVDAFLKLGDGTPVYIESKVISKGTSRTEEEIIAGLEKQFYKHLVTRVMSTLKTDVSPAVFDGKVPVLEFHLAGSWFTAERKQKIMERFAEVMKDPRLEDMMKADPKFVFDGTHLIDGEIVNSIIN
jgi:hypothetical protein